MRWYPDIANSVNFTWTHAIVCIGFSFVKLVIPHLIVANRGEDLVVELGSPEHGDDGGAHHVLSVGHRVRPQGQEERIAVFDPREAVIGLKFRKG